MNTPSTLYGIDKKALSKTLFPVEFMPKAMPQTYTFDANGIPCLSTTIGYHPALIARYALTCWNDYCQTMKTSARQLFLVQVQWFIQNEIRIGTTAGSWPLSSPDTKNSELSTTLQGCVLAILARAYLLTGEQDLLVGMQRVLATFKLDILDGGVHTPIGEQGIFFEERCFYPASHNLSSCIFALLCLLDYQVLMHSTQAESIIERALTALHILLPEFDTGYWTYPDLLHLCLSTPSELACQVKLLEALTRHTHCAHCILVAKKWKHYQTKPSLRRSIILRWKHYKAALFRSLQKRLFPQKPFSSPLRVCIATPAFPVLGGVQTVLDGIAQVTKDIWHIEYLTNAVGNRAENYVIHTFGTAKMGYWQFPMVWIHVLAGCRKLLSLMHRSSSYEILMPQDGVFTGAFAAIVGKLTGARVVCIDHGHLTLLHSKHYRIERLKMLQNRAWYRRYLSHLLYVLYWPSLLVLASIAARFIDCLLVPGIAGDGVEEVCAKLAIPTSRLVRFASMIAIENHPVLDSASRADIRTRKKLATNAIVIAIICRLAPEKGLDVALESIALALARSPFLKERVSVVIAGDGPLRQQLEDDVARLQLGQTCVFWSDIPQREVCTLLAISDIFLYTSTRGACFPMAVLEAMAAGCAVVASAQPPSNTQLLANGRGIAVRAGDVEQTANALTTLLDDIPICHRMGTLARTYIEDYHSPEAFRRTLLRATHWSGLDALLQRENGAINISH